MVLILLALASTEFGLSISHYSEIDKNIQLIVSSYRQIVAQMQAIYYITKIVLIMKNDPPALIVTNPDVNINSCKVRIEAALNEYYTTQNYISLSTISMHKEHSSLFRDKSVHLHYMDAPVDDDNERHYTLSEAIQQMSSQIFTVM